MYFSDMHCTPLSSSSIEYFFNESGYLFKTFKIQIFTIEMMLKDYWMQYYCWNNEINTEHTIIVFQIMHRIMIILPLKSPENL